MGVRSGGKILLIASIRLSTEIRIQFQVSWNLAQYLFNAVTDEISEFDTGSMIISTVV